MSRISAPFPERVGWYELLAPIGAGGMATVYLGLAERAEGFSRHVAVKMIHGTAEDTHLAADLLKEAKLVAKIRHPNVVPVIDVGEDPNGLFLVMEYIEGDNLAALRRAAKRTGEKFPEGVALRIVTDALAGLHAAHELKDKTGKPLGVVHRDSSPQNILVGTDGVSRLTDFGIAKMALTAGHTKAGKIKGKIAYMAPEQARGVKVDQRCDVWAAGVVAWEGFVGERLFDTDDEIGALLRIVNEDPPRLKSARPDLPDALDEAIASALCRSVDERCATADQLRRSLLAAYPVADSAEVAEFVKHVAGPKLADRVRRVEEIRKLRGQIGDLGAAEPSATSHERPASTPDVVPESATDATLTHVREEPTTGAPIIWRATENTPSLAVGETTASKSVERSIRWALGNPKRRAAAIGIAGGLTVGAVVLVGIIAASLGRKKAADTMPPAVPAAGGSVHASIQSATPSATASPDLPPPLVDPEFVVRSKIEIVTLEIGDERISVPSGSTEIGLDRRPSAGTAVEATAADGRKAKAVVPTSGRLLELEFPKASAGIAPVRPPKVPKTPKTTTPPFAENPYKKK